MIQNKTILLTGASKGIGRTLALLLSKGHNNLVLVARSEKELTTLKAECEANGAKTLIFVGSVADDALAKNAIETTIHEFGGIDFLINNAGYGIFKNADEIEVDEWNTLMETNVTGTFLFCKYAIPYMKTAQSGHIINVASDVAKRTFAGGSLYCASKFAQEAFSTAIRREVRPHNIKVSVIYSGLVDTPFHGEGEGREGWLQDDDMADAIHYVMNQPKHVVIDELMIHPLNQDY